MKASANAEHRRIAIAQSELQRATQQLNQQQQEAAATWAASQEELANRRALLDEDFASIDDERKNLADKTAEYRTQFTQREADLNSRQRNIAHENKLALQEKKRTSDDFKTRMTEMSSKKADLELQLKAATQSAERHKEDAATTRGVLAKQNEKISELLSSVADLQRQLKSREAQKARDHSSDSSSSRSMSRSRRNDARPATDDEDEAACDSAFRFWRERDKGLDISERSTSQYLAGDISLEAFTADWRRRLLPTQHSHESIPILVEEMVRRLRTAHQIVATSLRKERRELRFQKYLLKFQNKQYEDWRHSLSLIRNKYLVRKENLAKSENLFPYAR